MKWIYVVILIAIVAGVLSSDRLRSFIFTPPDTEQTQEENETESARRGSGRLQEAEATSSMGGEVAR